MLPFTRLRGYDLTMVVVVFYIREGCGRRCGFSSIDLSSVSFAPVSLYTYVLFFVLLLALRLGYFTLVLLNAR